MQNYVVPADTEAIVVGEEAAWNGQNFRLISTKQENRFSDDEVIINPITGQCRHKAPHAEATSTGWAVIGYFGFRKAGHCIIVHSKDVFVS